MNHPETIRRGRCKGTSWPAGARSRSFIATTEGNAVWMTLLSVNTNAHRWQDDIIDVQPRQLGYAKAGAHREVQHRPVANPFTLRRVGRIQQGLHLLLLEIGDQAGVGLLVRNRQDPTNLFQGGGVAILEKVKKRADRCQTNVAGRRFVATAL